jgi:drug/metabolite transporter (DMT)-like permease
VAGVLFILLSLRLDAVERLLDQAAVYRKELVLAAALTCIGGAGTAGYFFYKEGTSLQTYLSLIPICTGVAISCIDDLSFNFYGFLAAAASNFCFSGRAVLTKHLFRKFPNCIDEISMFAQISKVGLIILII